MGRRLKRSMLGWWPIKMFNMLLLATALVWSTGRNSLAEGGDQPGRRNPFRTDPPRKPATHDPGVSRLRREANPPPRVRPPYIKPKGPIPNEFPNPTIVKIRRRPSDGRDRLRRRSSANRRSSSANRQQRQQKRPSPINRPTPQLNRPPSNRPPPPRKKPVYRPPPPPPAAAAAASAATASAATTAATAAAIARTCGPRTLLHAAGRSSESRTRTEGLAPERQRERAGMPGVSHRPRDNVLRWHVRNADKIPGDIDA